MTTMFIANATAQFNDFIYSVPENPKGITQRIEPGGQIRISAHGGNLSPADVQSIINQHAPYGLIEAGKRQPGFNGLCYSLDKPVPFAQIVAQIRDNQDELIRRGKEARQNSAVASNERLTQQIRESGRGDVLEQLIVEVEEKTPARIIGSRRENEGLARELAESPVIAEGVRVTKAAPPPARGRRRRG